MLKRRLIPVLFLKNGLMVRSESFNRHQYIGNPILHVQRMMQWNVDELIVIDIGDTKKDSILTRDDYKQKPVDSLEKFISMIAIECGLPLTYGGNIKTYEEALLRIRHGADKIIFNQALFNDKQMIDKCVKSLGSQAVIASVDYKIEGSKRMVYINQGKVSINIELEDWVNEIQKLSVGEIFINSSDRDGKANGYDIETINAVSKISNIPIIACGGAGHQSHFLKAFEMTSASAIAAGNIFHFKENAYPIAKNFLKSKLNYIR